MMDAETVRWILTGLMGLVLWFGKRTIDNNEHRITDLETDRHNYIHKDSFKEFKEELRSLLSEIKQDIKDMKSNGS